jgi:hypothetical protein
LLSEGYPRTIAEHFATDEYGGLNCAQDESQVVFHNVVVHINPFEVDAVVFERDPQRLIPAVSHANQLAARYHSLFINCRHWKHAKQEKQCVDEHTVKVYMRCPESLTRTPRTPLQ